LLYFRTCRMFVLVRISAVDVVEWLTSDSVRLSPGTHWLRDWPNLITGLEILDRSQIFFPCRDRNPGSSKLIEYLFTKLSRALWKFVLISNTFMRSAYPTYFLLDFVIQTTVPLTSQYLTRCTLLKTPSVSVALLFALIKR
jgi:hypothetical protein